jgi:hypothetical protein
MVILRLALVVAICIAANVLTFSAPPSSLAATRVGGEAYGLAVGSPAVGVPGAAYVQVPPEGGSVSDTSPGAGYGVGNAVGSTSKITTASEGSAGAGTVTSTVTVADGELLGGVVRAHDIRIVASVSGGRPSAQVTFGTLLVAGIAYPNPQPNTRIDVPGVGIVIVNEQLVGGDGRDVGAIIVRAVRLQITEPSLFDLQRGTDLILAHAAAGVPDVIATRPVAAGASPTATQVPWAPISDLKPVDTSISNGNGNGNDNFDLGNGNGNTTVAAPVASRAATSGTSASSTPIKIIVIVCTPTAVPTATSTATAVPGAATPTSTPTPVTCS